MLVVDAGNSSAKFAVVARAGAKPRILSRVDNNRLAAPGVRAAAKKARAVSAVVASVVPSITKILRTALPNACFVGRDSKLRFRTMVDRRTVGADRLANMAEAARQYGRNAIVADFGTAATFDVLDGHGRFAGGAIAPGLRTVAQSLSAGTAQLPLADLRAPKRTAGRNTAEALRAGVAGGYAGMVLHLLHSLDTRGNRRIVFTGGDGARVAKLTGLKISVDPLWTLKGIAAIGEASLRAAAE